jgi:hypothetical protein
MGATTTQGTGPGAVEKKLPKIKNGVVKTANLAKDAVINVDVADNAIGTAELASNAVTTSKIANGSVTVAKMSVFKSTEQTGTGSTQNIAHGLGATPGLVMVYPTDTNVATTGNYVVTEGSHTNTNVVVTVTSGKKYRVVAFA